MNKKNMKGMLLTSMLLALGGVMIASSCSSDDSKPTSDVPENLKGTTGIEKFATKVDYSSTDSYHSADYTLFYVNIRENVAKRIETYFKSKF